MILVGFLGGYTTFSTFAFESVVWQRGEWAFSLANMAGCVLAGCAAVVLRGTGAGNRPSHLESAAGDETINGAGVDRREILKESSGG